jgi:glycosyltransferase involved in cell wall biosynthesis
MQSLSVLVIHNRYQQAGGEDVMVQAETDMLRAAGHRVVQYIRDNAEIANYSALRKASLLLSASWNQKAYAEVRSLIDRHRIDIVHCHNLLALVSPAVFYAARSAGVPVVQTLHNFRLVCPAGTLFWHGAPCQKCADNAGLGIRRGCYRDSRCQTAAVSLMTTAHRLCGTWRKAVDAYLAPSQFCRDYFIKAGLAPGKLHLKPNFLARDPGKRTGQGNYALFAGRLTPEKGVLEMIDAWIDITEVPLLIAGEGPLYGDACALIERSGSRHIKLLGHLDPAEVLAHLKQARFVIFPSRWYEPFGMVLLEAAACGVPVIASRIGAIPELVADHQTGLLFDPENFSELADQVRWAWNHPEAMDRMGSAARRMYEQKFTAEKNYQALIGIYRSLLADREFSPADREPLLGVM